MSDFLEKYVLESDTDSEGHKIPVLKKKSLTETGSPESATLTEGKSLTDSNTYERSVKSPPSKGIHSRLIRFVITWLLLLVLELFKNLFFI